MTVVVWDGNMLAADRMAVSGGTKYAVQKIFRLPDGSLVGVSGCLPRATAVVEWLKNGAVPSDYPQGGGDAEWVTVLHIRVDGSAVRYEHIGHPIPLLTTPHAIGSGRDYALGAMLASGCGAARAVEIAIELSADCGMGIDSLTLIP